MMDTEPNLHTDFGIAYLPCQDAIKDSSEQLVVYFALLLCDSQLMQVEGRHHRLGFIGTSRNSLFCNLAI